MDENLIVDRLDKLAQAMERLEAKVDSGFGEVRQEIAVLSARVGIIKNTVDKIDERLEGMEQVQAYYHENTGTSISGSCILFDVPNGSTWVPRFFPNAAQSRTRKLVESCG